MTSDHVTTRAVEAPPATSARRRPRYFVLSGDVKAASLQRLRYLQRMDVYHVYQRTRRRMKADDTSSADFAGHNHHAPTPFHVLWHLHRAKPDIVQGPEPFSVLMFPYLLAVYFYLLLHPRVRLVVNSLEPIALEQKYGALVSAVMRLVLRPYFRRAAIIFWFVPGVETNLARAGAPAAKMVQHVYADWGVRLPPETIRPKAPDAGSPLVMLYVGRLVREKGAHIAIEAFRLIRERGIDARLRIVGDGPERGDLERQAADSGFGGDVTLSGLVPQDAMEAVYRSADVFVAPYLRTRLWVPNLDNVYLEAMAAGLPLVVTDTVQNRAVIGDDVGAYATEGDARAFADSLFHLLRDNEERARRARAGRRAVSERYDPDRNAASAERLILQATGFDDAA